LEELSGDGKMEAHSLPRTGKPITDNRMSNHEKNGSPKVRRNCLKRRDVNAVRQHNMAGEIEVD
jgi:hypothetical protein